MIGCIHHTCIAEIKDSGVNAMAYIHLPHNCNGVQELCSETISIYASITLPKSPKWLYHVCGETHYYKHTSIFQYITVTVRVVRSI